VYIPSFYKESDFYTLLAFMQHHNFAIVCSAESGLRATHLPFVIEEKGNGIVLTSHLARANPQARLIEGGADLLIIFSGPHAYISPTNYEKEQNVPTWNYQAVHAYGKAVVIDNDEKRISILEKMIGTYEPAYQKQWSNLSPEYKEAMLKGIVAFEIEVTNLEGKFKLSQNKTQAEQQRIISSLGESPDAVTRALAEEMKKRTPSEK
jgi:transcriptional regulator